MNKRQAIYRYWFVTNALKNHPTNKPASGNVISKYSERFVIISQKKRFCAKWYDFLQKKKKLYLIWFLGYTRILYLQILQYQRQFDFQGQHL